MSQSFAEQPFEPGFGASAPNPSVDKPVRYMESFQFIFREQHWLASVLLVALCGLSTHGLPILGFIVVMGYLCEIFDSFQRRIPGYPAFDFNRLGAYLSRGVWPFLAAFIMQLMMMAVMFPLCFGGFLAVMGIATSFRHGQELIMGVGFVVLGIVVLAVSVGLQLFMTPVVLRAMIREDLNDLFEMGFIKDFVRRTGKELILCSLFETATGIVLMAAGALALCVGMYFSFALCQFSSIHLSHQLYDLYLARGGTPIPRKPLPPVPSVNPA